MELNDKEQALNDIREEINVVLSIKDNISEDEIQNFKEEFSVLTEKEIREQIVQATGDSSYIENYNNETEDIDTKTEKIEDNDTEVKLSEIEYKDTDVKLEQSENKYKDNTYESKENITSESSKKEEPNEAEYQCIAEHEENQINLNNVEPENISIVREEVKYNQLCLEWDWPIGINKVLVCYRNDRFPLKPEDKDSNRVVVEKKAGDKFGEFIISKLKEESYYFWVFPIVDQDEKKYMEGKKRLVVNKAVTEIYYEVKKKKSLFGKVTSAKIVLKTVSDEINVPPMSVMARIGNIPILKNDGDEILKSDYLKISKNSEAEIDLPLDKIGKNMYIKLFIKDEKSSGLFRLIPPKMEQLYFK